MAFWEFVGTAVGGIVGGAAIVGAAIKWGADGWLARRLEDYKASLNKEMDNHRHELESFADRRRLLLKREELMFERELAAAAEFMEIMDSVLPKTWTYHDDWYHAQTHIAGRLHIHQNKLQSYYARHSVALSSKAREYISTAIMEANDGALAVGEETGGEDYGFEREPGLTVCEFIDDFYKAMKSAEEQLRADLKNGSFGS